MKKDGIVIRRPNKIYYELIDRYFDQLVPRLLPLQYHLGGNIINIQIEDDSDVPIIPFDETHQYYEYLHDGLTKRGIQTLINTLAWPDSLSLIKAIIPNTWTALEYTVHHSTPDALEVLRRHAPNNNPFMVMEYYPGWMDFEGKKHETLDSQQFADGVDKILSYNGSVSFYMVFGGTNFQFTNGGDWTLEYNSITTSYDYDTMITEAGDAHATKFKAVHDVIAKYLPLQPLPTPSPSPKGLYGTIQFNSYAQLIDNLSPFDVFDNIDTPIQFEYLNQSYGYIIYSTQLSHFIDEAKTLFLPWMQDRATILLDGIIQGVIGWTEKDPITLIDLHPMKTNPNPRLDILVENKGRCCGDLPDFGCNFKGIKDKPLFGLKELSNWTITKLPMDNKLPDQAKTFNWRSIISNTSIVSSSFYRTTFSINNTQPLHSFLCTDNWGHGFIMINGFNIGRYSQKGPQRTMYVPASILKQGVNEILVFESDRQPMVFNINERNMTFMDHRLWSN
jgi:beta-galactosidase